MCGAREVARVMWTIVPPEVIWQQPSEEHLRVQGHPQGFVVVRAGRDGEETLERLIATDPKAYLDPALQPGGPPPAV